MSLRTIAATLVAAVSAAVVVLGPAPAAQAGIADAPSVPVRYRSTALDTPIQGNFCTGATDPQGDPITVSFAEGYPGDVTYDAATCAFTYTPPAGQSGQLAARFKLTDGTNVSDWMYVAVSVGVAGNAPVVAQSDAFATGKNVALLFPDLGGQLMANDADPEGQPMSLVASTIVQGGFLPGEQMLGVGYFGPNARIYYPPTDFVGVRRIEYQVSDGVNTTRQVYTITVTDNGPLKAPVAVADGYTVPKSGSLTVTKANGLLANDSDADSAFLRIPSNTQPSHGTLTGLDRYSGAFTYTPTAGYAGTDSFVYYVVDPEGNQSASVTVTLDVTTMPPTAVDDSYLVGQDKQLVVAAAQGLMANDSDPDSSFTVSSVLPPGHGTVSATHATGAFVYTPTPGWSGTDVFGYRLGDPDGNYSSWATVTVKVVAPGDNQAPVVHDDTYQVRQGSTLTVSAAQGPLANDSDFEGADIDVASHSTPAHGTFTAFDNETGAFTYVPAAGWHGTETITYKAVDPAAAQSTQGAITITVFNDPPTAHDDSYTTVPGTAFVVAAAAGLLVNDTDAEGESLTVDSWTNGQHGVVATQHDGSFVYTPAAGFTGTDSFTYDIRDAAWQQSAYATVTITVAEGTLAAVTPTISGTPGVGQSLTAVAGAWGPGTVTTTYQWLRDGAAIGGATSTTYQLTAADQGHDVAVEVSGSRTGYASTTRRSAARTVSAGVLTTARPTIAGLIKVGRRVKANPGAWGPGTVTLTYRWFRNGVAIRGATKAGYRLTRADKGKRITVRVTGSEPGYATVTRASATRKAR